MFQTFFVGLIALLIGFAFCFSGYRFFQIILPLWGFFAGFALGGEAAATLFGGGFLATALGWIVGIIVGLIFAGLSYFFYNAAVVILGAMVGYWLGTGLMTAIGFSSQGLLTVIVGVIVAIFLALLTIRLNVAKGLIIVLSALGGASMIITGVLLLLRVISLADLQYGAVSALIKGSWSWGIAWLILAVFGILAQQRYTQNYTLDYSRPRS